MREEMGQRTQEQETFGTVLRRIRKAKQLTQRAVARAINMDFSYFSRLEMDRFKSLPTRETIGKIADAMQCTDEERVELLATAGRVSVEMQERPALRRLYRTAMQLPPSILEELIAAAEERLDQHQAANGKQRKQEGDARSNS
jgi:transcriptional regulator with XRE-family HTH domain